MGCVSMCRRMVLAAFAWLALATGATAAPVEGSEAIRTVSDLLRTHPNAPIHIIFIHGIRTETRGSSLEFQAHLCSHIAGGCSGVTRSLSSVLYMGPRPAASYLGGAIWGSDETWNASQPFVDHYVYERPSGPPIIVDEINWWPLVFPIKCRALIGPDAQLAGPERRIINLCANLAVKDGQLQPAYPDHYAWLTRAEAAALVAAKPWGGGAAWANRALKTEILDWGVSDAVISLGVMKTYLHRTVQCAMENIAQFDPGSAPVVTATDASSPAATTAHRCENEARAPRDARFVIVSHSLGSFLLLDTFAAAAGRVEDLDNAERGDQAEASAPGAAPAALRELCQGEEARSLWRFQAYMAGPANAAHERERRSIVTQNRGLCFVIQNSDNLFFLANQFPLLEIARLQGLSQPVLYGDALDAADAPSPSGAPDTSTALVGQKLDDALKAWADIKSNGSNGERKQIIAFSDPSDILTYPMPQIHDAVVINITVHNATDWFHLFERPDLAHIGYFSNPTVLKTIFGN